MFDLQTAFYRPLWLRSAIVILCLGWAIFEATMGSPGWAMLFGALGIYCVWQFFIVWAGGKEPEPEAKSRARQDTEEEGNG